MSEEGKITYDPADHPLEDFLPEDAEPDSCCTPAFEDYSADIEPGWDDASLEIVTDSERLYALATTVHGFNTRLLYRESVTAPWRVVGYYDGPTVCIEDAHQGLGLGAELILFTARVREAPPHEGWGQMWSEAGIAAHRAAWHLAIERKQKRKDPAP